MSDEDTLPCQGRTGKLHSHSGRCQGCVLGSENYRSHGGFNRFHVVTSVDTFCIDKRSSAELSEAINSMFQWYAGAHICYDLADVESEWELVDLRENVDEGEHGQAQFLSSDFARSRWFTRGWTLQELIAPAEISFFGKNWIYLGSNKSLTRRIARITGIDRDILRSGVYFTRARLNAIPVARKMSWASRPLELFSTN